LHKARDALGQLKIPIEHQIGDNTQSANDWYNIGKLDKSQPYIIQQESNFYQEKE
jgi:hypothetical protein